MDGDTSFIHTNGMDRLVDCGTHQQCLRPAQISNATGRRTYGLPPWEMICNCHAESSWGPGATDGEQQRFQRQPEPTSPGRLQQPVSLTADSLLCTHTKRNSARLRPTC